MVIDMAGEILMANPAEREIAALVKEGLSSKAIAVVRPRGVNSVENVRVVQRRKPMLDRRTNLFCLAGLGRFTNDRRKRYFDLP